MKGKDRTILRGVATILFGFLMALSSANATDCRGKLFSVTIDNSLSIGDVIDNLSETCNLTVILSDEGAKKMLNKHLYYVRLKHTTLKHFLDTVLKDNGLHYDLEGNTLKISYLLTKTFKIHYIAGNRVGVSSAHVTIANSSQSANGINQSSGASQGTSGAGSAENRTGISITSNDEFNFWKKVEDEISRILQSEAMRESTVFGDSNTSMTLPKQLRPIVNPEAGMITVVGTQKQLQKVAEYIKSLEKQLKEQVLIDVQILSVQFDDSSTTGVDWSQLYKLQDFTVDSLLMARKNIDSATYQAQSGITNFTPKPNVSNGSTIILNGTTNVSQVVKFLSTQGDVRSISSPRVMTLNNQPALISVGRELFYKITSATTASGQGGAVAAQGEQIDSVFAGILLDITPEIDDRGTITLKVNPSISDTVNPVNGNNSQRTIPPDLIRRQIASVIKVKDGQHAILGGLISTKRGTRIKKVPLLGDLPLFDRLFKRKEKIDQVEELVIIITPHIVRNDKSVTLKDLGYRKLNEK